MKTFFVHALLAAVLLPFEIGAAPLQISNNVRVDVLESVTTKELWNVAKPDVVEAASVLVDSRMFDPETRPRNGKWYGCAIVMIGTSDLDIKPVAVRIWTARPCELMVREVLSPNPQFVAEFDARLDARESLKIRIARDLGVTINGKAIGHIE